MQVLQEQKPALRIHAFRGIRPPWMVEVQILQEQISAFTSL
jgi:hypothetical protein